MHASMVGFLAFESGFTSLTLDRKILSTVRLQLIHSHSMDCTRVPWGSLTSMVISLVLVNGFINDRVIKWFLPCSTSTHVITWLDSCFWVTRLKTLDIISLFRLRWSMYNLRHIDPLCMSRGDVVLI
jgi:hypothetical protein